MKRHELKTDPAAFAAVLAGTKTHEIRFNDREFAVGDELLLRQTVFAAADLMPGQTNQYTGRELLRRVTHIQEGYGLAPGWVILSLGMTPVIELGHGRIEVGQGHHGDARVPAILFGRNGAGAVGIETPGDRFMQPGECIAAITFDNPESLDVVAEKLAELRARIWPEAPAASAADYEEVLAGHRRLVRELDVLLHGEANAARQASLADIIAQIAGVLDAMRRDGATLAKIYDLLTVNGKAPEGPVDLVRLVGAHVRTNRELGGIIHDITVGQQAAWIEWKHGGGAEEGMQWIENGLAGPGMIPGSCEDDIDADAPILKDAQAYFDRYSTWMEGSTPSDTCAAKLRAAKNDRELLDFIEEKRVALDYFSVDNVVTECVAVQAQQVIGRAATAREALRAAIRATDPQGDLFAAQDGKPC